MTDKLTKFADDVFIAVKGYIARSLESVLARVEVLEKRAPEKGEKGADGEDVDPLVVAAMVAKAVGEIPKPADGRDGKDAVLDVDSIIASVVAKIPPPANGKDGTNGRDAPDLDVKAFVSDLVSQIPKPENGRDGKDADAEAITKNVLAQVSKVLDGIPTPKDGLAGRDGKDVDPLVVAAMVAKAVGEIPKLSDGRDGLNGEPGRDAFAIEVLPEIDETRKYQRGSWAKHAGGLWMARSATTGMEGWDCIVDGVATIGAIENGGVRNFTLAMSLSSGKSLNLPFEVPAMIYHGVWTEVEHKQGDTVTWEGSLWHCEKSTLDKPGTSEAWKLCAKRGRDGKDGLKGVAGERGAEGRAGRDLTQLGFTGART